MSFLEIFQPGLKHLREERERQKMLVLRAPHGGGSPLGIDLDGLKATIVLPTPEPTPTPPSDATAEPPVTASPSPLATRPGKGHRLHRRR
jgi:hypothetical protein